RDSSRCVWLDFHRLARFLQRGCAHLRDPRGLRATIYNEVFQLLIIVLGLLPLLRHPTAVYHYASHLTGAPRHLWLGRPTLSPTANLDQFGVIAGLGFVLSFSYWCTDFVQ